jgi:CBS domain-containing protein
MNTDDKPAAPQLEQDRPAGRPPGPADTTPVSKIMTREVVCVLPDLGIEALTQVFLERGISGAPVVDPSGRTLGIVSKTDVLRDFADRGETGELGEPEVRSGGIRAELERGMHVARSSDTTVQDVMTPLTFALPEDASIARASALMYLEGVHRVPVIASSGRVVGILSALDVLGWLARDEGYSVPAPRG